MKIRHERTYPYRTDAVWAAMTDARAIRQWWLDTDFEPVPGREFFFRDRPQGGWDGVVRGRVLEANPPRMVRFSWTGGAVDTVVTYDLTPTADGGTTLVLTHEGFRGLSGLFLGTLLRFGWRGYVRRDVREIAAHLQAHGFDRPFPRPAKAASNAAA
jgi:uncharacterized protein YndB with AHSA1/START domain